MMISQQHKLQHEQRAKINIYSTKRRLPVTKSYGKRKKMRACYKYGLILPAKLVAGSPYIFAARNCSAAAASGQAFEHKQHKTRLTVSSR
eukprot:16689-Heterococcus_DN1.PRE.12